jgi:hypothetical protein
MTLRLQKRIFVVAQALVRRLVEEGRGKRRFSSKLYIVFGQGEDRQIESKIVVSKFVNTSIV